MDAEKNDKLGEMLNAYFDGELSSSEQEAVEALIATDTDVRKELDALRRTAGLVNDLPRESAPASVMEGFRNTVVVSPRRHEPWESSRARVILNRTFLSAAAVVAVGVGLGAWAMFQNRPSETRREPEVLVQADGESIGRELRRVPGLATTDRLESVGSDEPPAEGFGGERQIGADATSLQKDELALMGAAMKRTDLPETGEPLSYQQLETDIDSGVVLRLVFADEAARDEAKSRYLVALDVHPTENTDHATQRDKQTLYYVLSPEVAEGAKAPAVGGPGRRASAKPEADRAGQVEPNMPGREFQVVIQRDAFDDLLTDISKNSTVARTELYAGGTVASEIRDIQRLWKHEWGGLMAGKDPHRTAESRDAESDATRPNRTMRERSIQEEKAADRKQETEAADLDESLDEPWAVIRVVFALEGEAFEPPPEPTVINGPSDSPETNDPDPDVKRDP